VLRVGHRQQQRPACPVRRGLTEVARQ
jgi:hypothetical protein